MKPPPLGAYVCTLFARISVLHAVLPGNTLIMEFRHLPSVSDDAYPLVKRLVGEYLSAVKCIRW